MIKPKFNFKMSLTRLWYKILDKLSNSNYVEDRAYSLGMDYPNE